MQFLKNEDICLSNPHFIIMDLLTEREYTVTDLSQTLDVKPSAITSMIDRMVKRGLVIRERDETDRRIVHMKLSEEGKEVYLHAKEKRNKIIEHYMTLLEPKELENFVQIYEKVAKLAEKEM